MEELLLLAIGCIWC